MSIRLAVLGQRLGVVKAGVAFHLHHQRRPPEIATDGHYRANVDLLAAYRRMSRDDVRTLADTQRAAMGALDRYAPGDTVRPEGA